MISIVIPVKNEGAYILNTVNSILQSPNETPYEIIVIDDHSDDGCCEPLKPYAAAGQLTLHRTTGLGLARAKNLGAELALGDILLFCDGHLIVPPYWVDRISAPLRDGALDGVTPGIAPHDATGQVGYGQTWNEKLQVQWLTRPTELSPVPILPGGCMAVRASVFQQVQGFDSGFRVWGYEDQEISLNLWLQGYTLGVNPEVTILHVFRQQFPYPVRNEHVNYNLLRLAYTHFNYARIQKVVKLIGDNRHSQELIQQVQAGRSGERRNHFLASRVYNDDWYMERFGIPF